MCRFYAIALWSGFWVVAKWNNSDTSSPPRLGTCHIYIYYIYLVYNNRLSCIFLGISWGIPQVERGWFQWFRQEPLPQTVLAKSSEFMILSLTKKSLSESHSYRLKWLVSLKEDQQSFFWIVRLKGIQESNLEINAGKRRNRNWEHSGNSPVFQRWGTSR